MTKNEKELINALYNRVSTFNAKHGINAEAINFVKAKVKELQELATDEDIDSTSDHLDRNALANNFPQIHGKAAKESAGETMLSTDAAENAALNGAV